MNWLNVRVVEMEMSATLFKRLLRDLARLNAWCLVGFIGLDFASAPLLHAGSCRCEIDSTKRYLTRTAGQERRAFEELVSSGTPTVYRTKTLKRKFASDSLYLYRRYDYEMAGIYAGLDPFEYTKSDGSENSEITYEWDQITGVNSPGVAFHTIAATGSRGLTNSYDSAWMRVFCPSYVAWAHEYAAQLAEDGLEPWEQSEYEIYSATNGPCDYPMISHYEASLSLTNGNPTWSFWYPTMQLPYLNEPTNSPPKITPTHSTATASGTPIPRPDPFSEGQGAETGGGGNDKYEVELNTPITQSTVSGEISANIDGQNFTNAPGATHALFEMTAEPGCLSGRRTDFRFEVSFRAMKGTTYEVSWEITTNYSGCWNNTSYSASSPGKYTEEIKGDGTFKTVSRDYIAPVLTVSAPTGPGSYVVSTNVTIRIANACVRPIKFCDTCFSQNVPGDISVEVASVHADFTLGADEDGQFGGLLQIKAELPSLTLATPDALQFKGAPNVVLITANGPGTIRYYSAPQALAEVVKSNDFKYALRFYARAGEGYQTNNPPFVIYTVENPDASTNQFNRLRITEARGAQTIANEYVWSDAYQNWALTTGNGLRQESLRTTWNPDHTLRTVTRDISDPGSGKLVKRSVQKHQRLSWGEALVEEIEGLGSAAHSTTNSYYDGGLLRQVTRSDGAWEIYEYDSYERQTRVYSGFLNLRRHEQRHVLLSCEQPAGGSHCFPAKQHHPDDADQPV